MTTISDARLVTWRDGWSAVCFLRSGGGEVDGEGGESAAGGRGSIETLGIGSGGLSIAMMILITA